jgi:PHD/YefM family antitoxin component YafN of YafNO toxin-antitoxin module
VAVVIDPRDDSRYVLLPASEFEAVRDVLEEERRQQAIRRTGLKNAAGRMGAEP